MTEASLVPLLATGDDEAHQRFVDLVAEVRPELFKYCARMTGSIFDGEDIVQETLARAYAALGNATEPPPLRPWLFRVAHNAAMDFLKRYERKHVDFVAEAPEPVEPDVNDVDPALVEAALVRFMDLPLLQRSALVLKDVLGHSLAETAETMGISVSAVKAALVRARENLSQNTPRREPRERSVSAEEHQKLRQYAELFNNRDWDGLRALMGEQSRLEVMTRVRRRGRAAAEYYTRYAEVAGPEALRAEVGWVDTTPVIAIFRPASAATPAYFILIEWDGEKVSLIRDFRYVPYLTDAAEYASAENATPPEHA
ncbi:MAG TPA: sigma-70 family RNA polymerase sigma factor [Polyangiaceae bacterium]|nr:sigma-70 family RNA polymerase sigma factor [Polyangiaceae bacterium]